MNFLYKIYILLIFKIIIIFLMKNEPRLFKILRIIEKEDFGRLKKMLRSPFFTANKNLIVFFNYLIKFHPELDSYKLQKEIVYRKIFPKKEYSDSVYSNLCADCLRLIEDYLLIKENQPDLIRRELGLLKIYHKKKASELYKNSKSKFMSRLEKNPIKDFRFQRHLFDLNEITLEQIGSKKLKLRVQVLHEALEINKTAYLLSEMKIKTELDSFANIKEMPKQPNFLGFETNFLLKIYDLLEKSRLKGVENLHEIEKLFFSNLDKIKLKEQLLIFETLINESIRLSKSDLQKYQQLTFELYKKGLEKGLFPQENTISGSKFMNIALLGAKFGEFEWAKKFIIENERFLPAELGDGTKQLSLAQIKFYEKDFESIPELIENAELKIPLQDFAAKLLMIRTTYELFLKNTDLLENLFLQIENLRRWNYRNSEFDVTRRVLNFSTVLKRIAEERVLKRLPKSRQIYFEALVNEQSEILSKQWLIDKLKD